MFMIKQCVFWCCHQCCLKNISSHKLQQNPFKGNIGETPERRGGAHIGLPERIDTILNWTELIWTAEPFPLGKSFTQVIIFNYSCKNKKTAHHFYLFFIKDCAHYRFEKRNRKQRWLLAFKKQIKRHKRFKMNAKNICFCAFDLFSWTLAVITVFAFIVLVLRNKECKRKGREKTFLRLFFWGDSTCASLSYYTSSFIDLRPRRFLHAVPAHRASAYLISAFPAHSTSFSLNILQSSTVECVLNSESEFPLVVGIHFV